MTEKYQNLLNRVREALYQRLIYIDALEKKEGKKELGKNYQAEAFNLLKELDEFISEVPAYLTPEEQIDKSFDEVMQHAKECHFLGFKFLVTITSE